MLDLSDPLFITSLLLKLVLSVALTQGSVPVALREGAKYPYVEICAAPVSTPEVIWGRALAAYAPRGLITDRGMCIKNLV